MIRRNSMLVARPFAFAGVLVATATLAMAQDVDPRDTSPPDQIPEAVQKVVAFDKAGEKLDEPMNIAYVTECITNSYCEARLRGLQDAADKFGFTFKIFDANFNPQAQLKHVQNAVQEGFDGYIFAPTADAPACKMWKDYLVPTGKPVVSLDLTMCGDVDYTEGLAATVTMQSQPYFDFHIENAFKSACEGKETCTGVSLSGFAGSDLFTRWENAIDNGLAKYPNVEIVSRTEARFDPGVARQLTQDALQVHPDLDFVVSHYDDMTLGAVAAIKAAGLEPGKDVLIFSDAGNKLGMKQIEDGIFNATTLVLPYDESYYAGVAMVMALKGQPLNAYINEKDLPRITDTVGTLVITKENADKYTPNW
ncbi:MAG: sugar ABC transporter substrate-binding protein [Bauldia sp.]|nr:sugar ABC transporter substrate-binding protein [Bauldia sp.]